MRTDLVPAAVRWWQRPVPAPWDRRILWANLIGQIGIVVTGGLVRLTGSGLGCSTWPQCEPGQFTPEFHEAATYHAFVEFGNRTLTGVLMILGVLTLWATWNSGRARSYRWLGTTPLIGVLAQALIGGAVVLLHLHPATVSLHFLVSMVLIVLSTVLLIRHREGDGERRVVVSPLAHRLTLALAVVCGIVVVLGSVTTGAGPHSGDDEVAYRLAIDPVWAAKLHAWAVWIYVALLLAVLVLLSRTRREAPGAWHAALVLLFVTLAQGALGYLQYFTGLPIWMVATHMLGASVLVAAQAWQALGNSQRCPIEPCTSATLGRSAS